MKIVEAMVYLLATSQHGMKTEQIARELELRGVVPRRPGRPPLDGSSASWWAFGTSFQGVCGSG